MNKMILASCERSGVILFTDYPPKGVLPIVYGRENDVHALIQATSRLAYDNKTWLVPGIPEAINEDEAFEALVAYTEWIESTVTAEGMSFGPKGEACMVMYGSGVDQ